MTEKKTARGRMASRPGQIPFRGWIDILLRVKDELIRHNASLVAAGVAFYFFIALFPTIGAIFSIYGLVTTPEQVEQQLIQLLVVVPADSHETILGIVKGITNEPDEALGISFVISLLITLWSTSRGMSALFSGINIAYNEKETRNFFKLNGLLLLFTLGSILLISFALALVVGAPELASGLELPEYMQKLISYGRWPILLVILIGSIMLLYHVAPSRTAPKFSWVNYGAIFAGLLWLAASLSFSYYVSNFSSYDKLYGSFAAIITLQLWLYISALVLFLGAELNSEMEHQTKIDTTVGEPRPMGERGAYHADHVAPRK
ncbi:MAG: YihY/virulence factor BrkB family protein [Roseivirga sp.]